MLAEHETYVKSGQIAVVKVESINAELIGFQNVEFGGVNKLFY
jgi:hypothetical protein